ncbi:uncharacterized protein CDV56_102668 [Aspergillus thermomutatus]|uniref:Uncharacterized protein n=1 Tax=Aspergillus thermomutatus TaxID=41047 RepID=A0A397G8J1_ASPTH|nr:uncharacterized protein CDV56_102668 [Aspergillus thermomutatus]RHZ44410.1 hypothetical protein CDV56_102668 [Aspergillus thermomutatus]
MSSPPVDTHATTQLTCHHDDTPDRYHTCVNDYHAAYSENNLPPLLFRMETPAFDNLPPLRDLVENNRVVKDRDGRPIRDFPFLPRYISIRPAGWLLEYWMRTDQRLAYRDIKSRMAVPEAQRPRENSLNMRRERECRNPLALSCWTSHRSTVGKVEVERVARWSLDQIKYNTTMEIEYRRGPDNRRTAVRLRSKTLAGGVPAYYPLDLFLDGGELHSPSQRVREALSLFWQLSERASRLQLGSWKLLPADELPEAWRRRAQRGNMGGERDVEAGSMRSDSVQP